MLGGAPFSIALPFDQCVVPANVNGPVALYITSDGQPLANNIRDQATNSIVAGPTMAYIDIVSEALGSLARPSGGAFSGSSGSSSSSAATSTSSSVTTITPDQASSILASIEPSATLTVSASAATATATAAAGSNNAAAAGNSVVLAPGGPNMYTGPTGDGTLTVIGWSTVSD